MECSSCGTLNNNDAEFCRQCGSKLGVRECPKCRAAAEPNARFCSMCGTQLLQSGNAAGRTCQSCGFINPAGTTYCKRCNQKIA